MRYIILDHFGRFRAVCEDKDAVRSELDTMIDDYGYETHETMGVTIYEFEKQISFKIIPAQISLEGDEINQTADLPAPLLGETAIDYLVRVGICKV